MGSAPWEQEAGARTCPGQLPAPPAPSFLPHLRPDGRTLAGRGDQTRWCARARPQWDLLSNVVYMLPGFIFSFRERSSSVRSYIPQPGPAVWGFTGRFHNHSKPRSSSPEVPAPRRRPSPQPFTPTPTFIKSLGDFPENGLIAMRGLTAVSLKHKSPCKASGPHCQAWAAHL